MNNILNKLKISYDKLKLNESNRIECDHQISQH